MLTETIAVPTLVVTANFVCILMCCRQLSAFIGPNINSSIFGDIEKEPKFP